MIQFFFYDSAMKPIIYHALHIWHSHSLSRSLLFAAIPMVLMLKVLELCFSVRRDQDGCKELPDFQRQGCRCSEGYAWEHSCLITILSLYMDAFAKDASWCGSSLYTPIIQPTYQTHLHHQYQHSPNHHDYFLYV